ncbi:MAG: acyl-CoA/acyl-ACP dehydrogenase [Desulfurococcales archaeon]|nr:acyl-CoA/acyl-ACP dehydrogenase [Desulfurococcales archaeon]
MPAEILEHTFYPHTTEARLLRSSAMEFAESAVAPRALRLDSMPPEEVLGEAVAIVREAAANRLLSIIVPEEVGGPGGLTYEGANVLEVLAYYDAGIATTIGAIWLGLLPPFIAGLGDGGESWRRWLKPFLEAEESGDPQIWAFAITEPEAGSDYERVEPGSRPAMTTVARPLPSGGYEISGRKIFIPNGPIASHVTVFAVTDPQRPIETMMCAVVTREMGFKVAQVFDKMGHRSSPTGELVFEEVRVPEENVLCKPGSGWEYVEMTLTLSRAPVGAIGLGIAKRAFQAAFDYARQRIQGGRPLVEHQVVKMKLARMLERIAYAENLIYTTTRKIDEAPTPLKALESSLAKAVGADVAVENALEAIQIHGGYGYMREMGVEKLLRDAKLIQIYEGTNEINRLTAIERYTQYGGVLLD